MRQREPWIVNAQRTKRLQGKGMQANVQKWWPFGL